MKWTNWINMTGRWRSVKGDSRSVSHQSRKCNEMRPFHTYSSSTGTTAQYCTFSPQLTSWLLLVLVQRTIFRCNLSGPWNLSPRQPRTWSAGSLTGWFDTVSKNTVPGTVLIVVTVSYCTVIVSQNNSAHHRKKKSLPVTLHSTTNIKQNNPNAGGTNPNKGGLCGI